MKFIPGHILCTGPVREQVSADSRATPARKICSEGGIGQFQGAVCEAELARLDACCKES